ncbi:MAG TPA: MFS transporter [Euzebyales bacterium]|nr:MFS transporter [Euzebyales bacterium]
MAIGGSLAKERDLADTIATEAQRINDATSRDTRRRALIAGCIGNLVEWYDFALFGAFAPVLATTFFPSHDPIAGLIATYVVFVVAFVARPAGALLFGHVGDRVGRRTALATGILLMSLVTAGTGLLPDHAAIGWPAPVLLALLRAGQGVAVGGEYGGSAAFVVEYAPSGCRGWYGGWQWATVGLGFAAGIAAAVLLSAGLSPVSLRSWGWRLPFLLAAPLGLIGLYIRTRLDDTPGFRAMQQVGMVARVPLADTLRTARRSVVIGFGLVAAVTVTFNVFFVFLPGYEATSGRTGLPLAFAAAFAGLIAASTVAPLLGRLSDRVGRRPVLICATVALTVLILPASSLIDGPGLSHAVLGYVVIGLVLGALGPTAFLSELFPTPLRYSGLAFTYGIASALFGGTAPVVAATLARQDGTPRSAAWYATAVAAGALVCVIMAPETANRSLDTGK